MTYVRQPDDCTESENISVNISNINQCDGNGTISDYEKCHNLTDQTDNPGNCHNLTNQSVNPGNYNNQTQP